MGATDHTKDLADLTSELASKLTERRELWNKWAESDKQKCEEMCHAHQSTVRQYQGNIDSTAQEILALQLQTDLNVSSKSHSEGSQSPGIVNENTNSHLENKLNELKETLVEQQDQKKALEVQALHEKERAKESRDIRNQVQESAIATIYHLSKAKEQYDWLGLEYEKSTSGSEHQGDEVRCVFTQIDSSNPELPFSCTLGVNDQTDLFEVQDCQPPNIVPDERLREIATELNAQDPVFALNYFVRSMRRAFQTELDNLAQTQTPIRNHS
uniref:Kinetochore protein SPC25 n=1 Tax=Entomoneis paludosa TaxID=265537 RepID=A0A7S2Y9J5_9STRA|mmetsp:Transcript_23202/g.48268  ORF Transcript_23202/g.48268 Transcript_23202/m.48268 type:complete len:270 (+) Transcript_23202:89-898(+)|eukprot:CAMPEP_0172458012 /NCGR_PEP_ID=MMETSP1065-20121228/25502_1 /TAXON_ID=265537 /ORGANISM="Amphiprora paludosa, Strain CCMP125" /LENGTH=269 /DNA_ID=CAMNT_0013212067 /DNA_START=20 /DNA_END=829 /DNA_ORIENTATION=-